MRNILNFLNIPMFYFLYLYKMHVTGSVRLWGFFVFLFKASQAWRKNKMDESKHEIHSQVDAITAGTASMVNLTAGRTVKHLELFL